MFTAGTSQRQLHQLNRALQELPTLAGMNAEIMDMKSRYLYLVECKDTMDPQTVAKLAGLLRVTEPLDAYETSEHLHTLFCMPHFERPSQWAINITRFLQDVSIPGLIKIERVAAYQFRTQHITPPLASFYSTCFDQLNTDEFGEQCTQLNELKTLFLNRDILTFEEDSDEDLDRAKAEGMKLSAHRILQTEWIDAQDRQHKSLGTLKDRLVQVDTYDNVIPTHHDDAAIITAPPVQAWVVSSGSHTHEATQEPIAIVTQSFQTPIDRYSTGCTSIDIGYGVKSVACLNGYRLTDAFLDAQDTLLPHLLGKRARYLSEMGVANLGGFVRLNSGIAPAMEVQQYGLIRQYETCLKAFDSTSHESDAIYVVLPLTERRRATQTLITRCNMQDQSNPILKIDYTHDGDLLVVIASSRFDIFDYYAQRECCPYTRLANQHVALASLKPNSTIEDFTQFQIIPAEKTPRIQKDELKCPKFDFLDISKKVLRHPTVADKRYLIHRFDRSLSGLVARDQLVGQWQVPVSDVAVTLLGYDGTAGVAMSVGECSFQLTQAFPEVAIRLAFAESLTNLFAADVRDLKDIKLSLYWQMPSTPQTDLIFKMISGFVKSVKEEFGIDTISVHPMQNNLHEQDIHSTSPGTDLLAFTIHAHAQVADVARTAIPRLKLYIGETELIYIDLSKFKGLAHSIFSECVSFTVTQPPEVDIAALSRLRPALISLRKRQWLHAYHDCSDGGLLATLSEIAFASHCGLTIELEHTLGELPEVLFSEAPGVVIQVRAEDVDEVLMLLSDYQLNAHLIGAPNTQDRMILHYDDAVVFDVPRTTLQEEWIRTSFELASVTGNPELAQAEFQLGLDPKDPGLSASLTFDPEKDITAPFLNLTKPKAGVLKSSCSTGYSELVAALCQAGFECLEIRTTDLRAGKLTLDELQFLAIGSGYAYGDVLGAGWAWSQSLIHHPRLRETFQQFFERPNTLTLGIGNGAQLLSYLSEMIPRSASWPTFEINSSEAYESRLSMVEIMDSKSLLTQGMAGSKLPIITAMHSGKAVFKRQGGFEDALSTQQIAMRYVDHHGKPTQQYPFNPSGAEGGTCGFCSGDGRVTGLIVHPERCFLSAQMSWHPSEWGRYSPWMRLFRNARTTLG